MKNKIFFCFIIFNFFLGTVSAATDTEMYSKSPAFPYGHVGGVNMIDTNVTIENGDVWIWAYRGSGQQGNGKMVVANTRKPARVETFPKLGLQIVQAAAGAYHIIVLDNKGDVWGWGQNGYWEAGGGVCNQGYVLTPCRILTGKNVVQIGAGEYISIALTEEGEVYTWGHGDYGALGSNIKKAKVPVQKLNFNNLKITMIGAAYEGGYAIDEKGNVWGWGDDEHDSFGITHPKQHEYRWLPIQLPIKISGSKIDYICGGDAFTEYLTSTGDVYGMGLISKIGQGYRDDSGRDEAIDEHNKEYGGEELIALQEDDKTPLDPKATRSAQPLYIMSGVKTLYCRYNGTIALTHDGKIYTWGSTGGDPNHMYGAKPYLRQTNGTITKIDGGKHHIMYWNDEGKVYGVGYGAAHKFDLGSVTSVDWPGKEIKFATDAMKAVYGQDYVPGQGFVGD